MICRTDIANVLDFGAGYRPLVRRLRGLWGSFVEGEQLIGLLRYLVTGQVHWKRDKGHLALRIKEVSSKLESASSVVINRASDS